MEKLSNSKLIKNIIKGVTEDMTNDEVVELVLNRELIKDISQKKKPTLGQRAADKIAKFAGSWFFIISFCVILLAWIVTNIILVSNAFDPYPFILLNLFLSCIAALQAPVIMMSQNRQEQKDRQRNENDYQVNLKTSIIIKDLYEKINILLKNEQKIIKALNEAGFGLPVTDTNNKATNDNTQTQDKKLDNNN